MDQNDGYKARLQAFAEGALEALTPDHRAECALMAELEPGMRLRASADDPETAELLWGGAVVGVTTWAWLNTGESPS